MRSRPNAISPKTGAGTGNSRVASVWRSVSPRVIPRSVAAQSTLWVTQLLRARYPSLGGSTVGYCRIWPDPVTTYFVEVISGRPIGPRACSF
jgi:hypothetical protein